MAFCPSCGTQAEGNFCPRCGAAMGATPPPPPGVTPGAPPPPPPVGPPAAGDLAENVASALCYIPLGGVLFLALEPYNRNPTIRFHAWQSNFYWGAAFLAGIALSIFTNLLSYDLWRFIWRVYDGAILVGWVVLMYKAYNNERWVMPVIGEMAQKQR